MTDQGPSLAGSVTTMAERAGLGLYELPERIDSARLDLVAEFMASPTTRHSKDLALLVGRMRSGVDHGPLLVLERSGEGRWTVMEAPGERGAPLVALAAFASRDDAERFAFGRRWFLHTGRELEPDLSSKKMPLPDREPPLEVFGYADPQSAAPGTTVRCHLSGSGTVEVVRLRPDFDRAAPDWPQHERVDGIARSCHQGGNEPVAPGSYGVIELGDVAASMTTGASLQATIALTTLPRTRQVIASWGNPWAGGGTALWIGPVASGATLPVGVSTGDGSKVQDVCLQLDVASWEWVTLIAQFDPSDRLNLRATSVNGRLDEEATTQIAGLLALRPWPQLIIGGIGSADGVSGPQDVREHFNGRIEQIALVGAGGISHEDTTRLAEPANLDFEPVLGCPLLGWWDMSIGISGWDIKDRGPYGLDGKWYNLPRRAVTGSRWDGFSTDWRATPDQYAAVHLLSDGVEDCAWPIACEVDLPADLASGFYAFRVTSEGPEHAGQQDQLIPFFVHPEPDSDRRSLTLLVPTATYAAYANSRFWWEDPIQEAVADRLVEIGPGDRALIEHSELGLSNYDVHADGTDVCHVSSRRPNLFLRPDNVHDEGYCSDLDLVAWLDEQGYEYDVITDLDLHQHPELLSSTKVLLTGTHPEYVSATEFDAIDSWVRSGGRMLYLGGNGFHTRIDFSAERPWIMENRRIEHWSGNWPTKSAEHLLATDGESGGFLASGGRTARRLVGVETATMGFDESRPFQRSEQTDSRTEFVFVGIEAEIVGDHGRLGGGVVGQEWDNSVGGELPDDHVVLAKTFDHSIVPPLFGAGRAPFHGEMTIRFDPSGGAVWAIGSMAWCAALADGSPAENDVARITANVINRFLEPEPFGDRG